MNWQEKLDEMFPYGASMTDVRNGEQIATFFTPRFIVMKQNGQPPLVMVHLIDFQKEVSFRLTDIEEVSPGTWVLHTTSEKRTFLVSINFGRNIKEKLQDVRRSWYGEGV